MTRVARALLSVSDKTGVVDFARALAARGIEIVSTGGTARTLRDGGVAVIDVSDHTGFPEIMDGRVKTLHPRVHGGLLGRRGVDDEVMAAEAIPPIDLLVVNLYPFSATVARKSCTLEEAIENIDIGGPAMLRAGAKNHASVTVVVDPEDYAGVVEELETGGQQVSEATRRRLAAKAFRHTAEYDRAIAEYLEKRFATSDAEFPPRLHLVLEKAYDLRYGENPHQRAAFYVEPGSADSALSGAALLQGKELSYNNIADADAALECVRQFYEPACVIVKHANPCGVAVDESVVAAYRRAYSTDTTSAFGGIIAVNRTLTAELAEEILSRQFVEVLVAPEVAPEARQVLAAKPKVRVLATGWWDMRRAQSFDYKRVAGGLLVQDRDLALVRERDLKVVTRRQPGEHEVRDLLFAWKVAKLVKSNAIVYCKDQMTIGIGAGQMSRVYSARIAAIKAADAGLAVKGSAMASDAFFPFRDSIDDAAKHGVIAVIQPGGSVRDEEVIAAADEHGMAMLFTGMRHFRH